MAVSTTSILNKLLQEAKQANENKASQDDMQKHVANVKLLCELLLDEEKTEEKANDHAISSDEMKAMIGTENRSGNFVSQDKKTLVEDEDANGKSLFDF